MLLKLCSSAASGNPETDDSFGFYKSLQELKELRSQIHYAADYCEKSFLNSTDKSAVVDNTKEYLCRAMVTVVDHLGSVSSNLNQKLQKKTDTVLEAQLRITCLKHKLESCDQFHHNFTLTKVKWNLDLPRFHPRYISPPSNSNNNKSRLQPREEPRQPSSSATTSLFIKEFKSEEDVPLFMYTNSNKISLVDKSLISSLDIASKGPITVVLPANEGFSAVTKPIKNHSSFQFQESRKVGGIRRMLRWKPGHHDNQQITSTLNKRSKRESASRLLLKLRS